MLQFSNSSMDIWKTGKEKNKDEAMAKHREQSEYLSRGDKDSRVVATDI